MASPYALPVRRLLFRSAAAPPAEPRVAAPSPDATVCTPPRRGRRIVRPLGWIALAVAVAGLVEARTSWLQAALLSTAARGMTYAVDSGPGPAIPFPAAGPYDDRLGYTRQPQFIDRLAARDFAVRAQARWSPRLHAIVDGGLFAIYREKTQAGLVIRDRSGKALYAARYPQRVYRDLEEIPPLVVRSILFIENRELLHDGAITRNPAIEYDRLARAAFDVGWQHLAPAHPVSGGSTIATQIEKLRHSPGGRTGTVREKGTQIASASLRAYLGGHDTREARARIVRDYLNALPLSAVPGYGEVIGLGDGLWAWYGADLDTVNQLLAGAGDTPSRDQAIAYRQVLSLLLAAKRPTTYLAGAPGMLDARVDSYLHALANGGVIPPAMRDAVRRTQVTRRRNAQPSAGTTIERKGTDATRVELLSRLGVTPYDLDRLDLTARVTLAGAVNADVARVLRQLADPTYARHAGLTGARLLGTGDPAAVLYSVTLYERGPSGNALRVQADNYPGPLNMNEGTRLELGSTAKLRTLVTYLEAIEELHATYAPPAARPSLEHRDPLTRWAVAYLAGSGGRSLDTMLEDSLDRMYSASPYEDFFTGGGRHTFQNFDEEDDTRVMTVREGFERSVNLVFVRVMRDVAQYHAGRNPRAHDRELDLRRFADLEGRIFLRRFHARRTAPSAGPRDRPTGHPLDQWLATYLTQHPGASVHDVIEASAQARQDAYGWLFQRPRSSSADRAVAVVREVQAFERIHASWRRLGYPFNSLVPSYATALGSSGDNPAALADLAGIILNGGIRFPSVRVEEVRFGEGTPYETHLARVPAEGERVMSPAVAAALRRALTSVVARGTGRRLAGGLVLDTGERLVIAGKTGTGDNEFETISAAGRTARKVNRTAAFVFVAGDRFFGTVMAFVPGNRADGYEFTSALPVQLLKHLLPVLRPLLQEPPAATPTPPA